MNTKTRLAHDICILNRWETPIKIYETIGRGLTREEIQFIMPILESYVPYKEWLVIWKNPEFILVDEEKSRQQDAQEKQKAGVDMGENDE